MPLTLPDDLETPAQREIKAGDLMTMFTAIAQKFGQITGSDFAPNPNIDGAGLALGSIPGNRLAAGAVGTTQLATDGVVSVKILGGAVTEPKLGASAVAKAKLKLNSYSQAPTTTIAPDASYVMSTALLGANLIPICVYMEQSGAPSGNTAELQTALWRDTATDIVYIVASNNTGFAINLTGNVTFRMWYVEV
jgi:hypothetical protein